MPGLETRTADADEPSLRNGITVSEFEREVFIPGLIGSANTSYYLTLDVLAA